MITITITIINIIIIIIIIIIDINAIMMIILIFFIASNFVVRFIIFVRYFALLNHLINIHIQFPGRNIHCWIVVNVLNHNFFYDFPMVLKYRLWIDFFKPGCLLND